MREYYDTFAFSQGLRKVEESPRNGEGLTELYNLKPWNSRITSITPIISPVDASIVTWPFPQLFCLSRRNYLMDKETMSLLDANWEAASLVSCTSHSDPWHVADFQKFVVFANGVQTIVSDPDTGILSPSVILPVMGCVCNYKGQLVAGNVAGYDQNTVVWGDIGSATLTINRSNVAGNLPLPWQGSVRVVKRLGERLAAYCDGGIAILQAESSPTTTFRLREVFDFGVASGISVGGDIHEHLFVSESGLLWKLKEDLSIEEVGYQEFILPLVGSTFMVSFDSHLRDYYISTESKCFLLTRSGLCEVYQRPSSAYFYSGGLIGVFSSSGDTSGRWKTDVLDFKLMTRKCIEDIHLGMYGTDVSLYLDTRIDTGAFITTPSFSVYGGLCSCRTEGTDFRIGGVMGSYTNKNFDWMRLHFKLIDKRFLRSIYARQITAGSDR
jgi:hypothetical protein